MDAYAAAPPQDRSFGHEANTRAALAVARVFQAQVDGAVDALTPVLQLPATQRTHGIVIGVERVRTVLSTITDPGHEATELAGAIQAFTAERLTQPR